MLKILFCVSAASLLVGCSQRAHYQPYKPSSLIESPHAETENITRPGKQPEADEFLVPSSVVGEVWGEPVRGKIIYEKYKSKKLERLKYESDAEYSARVGVLGDVYTISSFMSVNYNPETKKISMSESIGQYQLTEFGGHYREEGGYRKYYGVSAGYGDSKHLGYYEGSNAFGVGVEVSKYEDSEYYVILGSSENVLSEPTLGLVGDCSASSSEMRQAEGMINVEFLVRPIAPYTYSSTGYETPTISNPIERKTNYGFVRAEPLAARVKLNRSDKLLNGCKVMIFDARAKFERHVKSLRAY